MVFPSWDGGRGWSKPLGQQCCPSQPLSDTWTIQHIHCQQQMKQHFRETPHTNLNLEISMKIPSLHDPKGHLTSFSLVIWYNSVQKTSPNNFSVSSIISTGAVSGVKAFQRQRFQLGHLALRGATRIQNIIDCKAFFYCRTTSDPPTPRPVLPSVMTRTAPKQTAA